MSREDAIKVEGAVVEVLNNRLCRVELANGHRLLAHLPRGANHASRVMIRVGDKLKIDMSPFDFSKGRISAT